MSLTAYCYIRADFVFTVFCYLAVCPGVGYLNRVKAVLHKLYSIILDLAHPLFVYNIRKINDLQKNVALTIILTRGL